MLSLRLKSLKDATRKLFLDTSFDCFSLMEAAFICASSFTVDGHCNKDFFDPAEVPDDEYIAWSAIRPICFQMIKGKRVPLSFRLVFTLSAAKAAERFLAPALADNADIDRYILILHYKNQQLTVTTGTSFHRFSLDRVSEKLWDQMITRWLDDQVLTYEDLA